MNNEAKNDPIVKIEVDSSILAGLMHSSADALQAASRAGMRTVLLRADMSLRDFIRFCLGEAGALEGRDDNKGV